MKILKALILAGGYATNLFPLTENQPKPLISIADKPIVEYIIEKIEGLDEISEIFIITNNKFYSNFQSWLNNFSCKNKIKLLNDGSFTKESKLGPVSGLVSSINDANINDDLLVIAGDNLFEFDLDKFLDFFYEKKATSIILHKMIEGKELGLKYGVVELDKTQKIIHFEEKPEIPKSELISTGCYIFRKEDFKIISDFSDKNPKKEMGDLIEFLSRESSVYGVIFDKSWFDIGSFEALEHINDLYLQHGKDNT